MALVANKIDLDEKYKYNYTVDVKYNLMKHKHLQKNMGLLILRLLQKLEKMSIQYLNLWHNQF